MNLGICVRQRFFILIQHDIETYMLNKYTDFYKNISNLKYLFNKLFSKLVIFAKKNPINNCNWLRLIYYDR